MLDMNACATCHPILLIHGVRARGGKPVSGWGRIPAAPEGRGARAFPAGQEGCVKAQIIAAPRGIGRRGAAK